MPGAALFTTAPFGLPPVEHQTWIEQRGGQQLWDEFYRPAGVRGLLAGNTGPSMGGWFRKPITSVDDLKGLRIRVEGIRVFQHNPIDLAGFHASPRRRLDAVAVVAECRIL
jgi:TRAP-type mannitol/chloroaromatic compound transport system substrate-binding protein